MTTWITRFDPPATGSDGLVRIAVKAPPPLLTDFSGFPLTRLTAPFNLAGVPAISMPVPSPGFPVPVSLQLVGPMRGEDLLCATGFAIEAALNRRSFAGKERRERAEREQAEPERAEREQAEPEAPPTVKPI